MKDPNEMKGLKNDQTFWDITLLERKVQLRHTQGLVDDAEYQVRMLKEKEIRLLRSRLEAQTPEQETK